VAGTIIADVIQSDQSYPSSINIASPVIISNTFAFPAGTVSAPAFFPTGDTNTGIFFPAADTMAFAEGGVEAMRIDSSGRVGIGTTSPQSQLDIRGSTDGVGATLHLFYNTGSGRDWAITSRSDGSLRFADDTAATERMRIDSSGRVLIGTTNFEVTSSTGFAFRPIGSASISDSFVTAWSIPEATSGLLFVQNLNNGQYGGCALFMVVRPGSFSATVVKIAGFSGDVSGYSFSHQLSGNNLQLKHNIPGVNIPVYLKFIAM